MNETIFITSQYYKELLLLDIIAKHKDITQRDISANLNVSATMVNNYIDKCEEKGLINRTYYSTKNVKYSITSQGEERRKLLYMQYLKASMDVFNSALSDCVSFLKRLVEKGYKNVLFYGAGEVGKILLYTAINMDVKGLDVLAIIDDDDKKIGNKLFNIDVISITDIKKYQYDGILISSYTNKEKMKRRLLDSNIPNDYILEYI